MPAHSPSRLKELEPFREARDWDLIDWAIRRPYLAAIISGSAFLTGLSIAWLIWH